MNVKVLESKINYHYGNDVGSGFAVIIDPLPTEEKDIIELSDKIRAAVQAWERRKRQLSNDRDRTTCDDCGGRIALMTGRIGEAKMHEEPFQSGVVEGDKECHQLSDYVTVSMHVCDCCGKVFSKTFED